MPLPENQYTLVYNLEVEDFHTYYVTDSNILVHNDCKVKYGSTDLSKNAINYRKANDIRGTRNVAVFEYKSGDSLKTITKCSGGGRHAERIIADELKKMNIDYSNVTRIYSELQPCITRNGSCRKFISEHFLNAKVSYSFEYGDALSRKNGVKELRKAVNNIWK